jgi:mannose-6-phosphate isomerase-like protein (cupin superfamily)
VVDIFSRTMPGTLLFRHITCEELLTGSEKLDRTDYCDPKEPLQVACIRSPQRHTFAPHIHITNERTIERTQELWYIVTGSASVELYDLNAMRLDETVHLGAGDILITYAGGHEYTVEPGTVVVEVKNGPWLGRDADKAIIHA